MDISSPEVFSSRMVRCWNSLPRSVFSVKYDLAHFKRNVNRFLKPQNQSSWHIKWAEVLFDLIYFTDKHA
jgi:hypothetical protein